MSNQAQHPIRVRFAPSPTGHLHVGNARTALLNWLFARHNAGQFVLRIEDTDVERSRPEFERSVREDLHWLGLDWDEGPEVGGPFGPYHQSQRLSIYRDLAERLEREGRAYRCYCTPEELAREREEMLARGESPKYSGRCRNLTREQREAFEREGRSWTLRFRVDSGSTTFTDLIKGEVTVDHEMIGDFVIVRSDGTPTYNFACVIDDALMRISHVIRAEDHLSNTPKQLLLYEALGFTAPSFAHVPLILGPDRMPLSKRHGATSVQQFRELGYLPEALVSFLSGLSWSSPSGEEILSLEQLVGEFDLSRVATSPAIFNFEKLRWMNGVFIRKLPLDRLVQLAKPYLEAAQVPVPSSDRLERMLALVQDRLETLADVADELRVFFFEPRFTAEVVAVLRKDSAKKVLWSFLRQVRMLERLDADSFRLIMKEAGNETGILGKDLWMPVRAALTGRLHGPSLAEVAALLGKEVCEKRIAKVLGVS